MSEAVTLTGQQRRILREAILSAYPNPDDLQILLSEQMDVQLGAIARRDAYNARVFSLIQDFEADGRIEEFIRVVVNDKPNSPYLAAIKNEFAGILGKLGGQDERKAAAEDGVLHIDFARIDGDRIHLSCFRDAPNSPNRFEGSLLELPEEMDEYKNPLAMAATLRASQKGLEKVEEARNKKDWDKTAKTWWEKAHTSESTLKRFWGKHKIQQPAFIDICKAVGIEEWEEIVDNSPTQSSYIEFCEYRDEEWVGRESLINDLSQKVQDKCRVLLLVGITGIGKTSLAERLIEELRGDWLEFRENFEIHEQNSAFELIALRWLEKMGERIPTQERQPEQLLKRLIKRLCENPYLILLDSLEYLLTGNKDNGWSDFTDNRWKEFFRKLLGESPCQSRLIITSQDFPAEFDRECRYTTLWHSKLLKGLEESEQINYFQKAELEDNLESSDSPLRLIGQVYDGHPLALRTIVGEIKKSWYGDVRAYWNQYRHDIEAVKEALNQARNEGIVEGQEDRWQLTLYTDVLRKKVRERIEKTFERLKNDFYEAYFLLCTASIYRCVVREKWWLSNLADEGYTEQHQKIAMQALRERYLIEDGGLDDEGELLVGQHNLIRDVAIAHRLIL